MFSHCLLSQHFGQLTMFDGNASADNDRIYLRDMFLIYDRQVRFLALSHDSPVGCQERNGVSNIIRNKGDGGWQVQTMPSDRLFEDD